MKKSLLLTVLATMLAGAVYGLLREGLAQENPRPGPPPSTDAIGSASLPQGSPPEHTDPDRTRPASPARPPRQHGLRIKVIDQDLAPVANAMVTFEGDSNVLPPAKTGLDGFAETSRLPRASVLLRATDRIAAGPEAVPLHRSGQARWSYRDADLRTQVLIVMRPDRLVHVLSLIHI